MIVIRVTYSSFHHEEISLSSKRRVNVCGLRVQLTLELMIANDGWTLGSKIVMICTWFRLKGCVKQAPNTTQPNLIHGTFQLTEKGRTYTLMALPVPSACILHVFCITPIWQGPKPIGIYAQRFQSC